MNKHLKFLAFDIEISRIMPEGVDDWSKYRPLGISCAAALPSDGEAALWYGKSASGDYSSQMGVDET